MNITITPKQFSSLARTFQNSVSQYVDLPKGHYCHILEATARGLGFSSKTMVDHLFQSNCEIHIPFTHINERAAQQWMNTTSGLNIPSGVFQTSVQHHWPHFINENHDMKPFYKVFEAPQVSNLANATSNIVSKYAGVIWSTADVLRGVGVKASEWPNHMMPFFALMLVESRAVRIRDEVLANFGAFDPTDPHDVADLRSAYMAASGNSHTYHEDLVLHKQDLTHVVNGGSAGFTQRLNDYLNGYDAETRRLLGINPGNAPHSYLNIDGTVRFLSNKEGDALHHYCSLWAKVDLSQYDSSAITTLEEHIKRKWADISADTAGEHYTPADLIELVSRLILSHLERHPLQGNILKIYDPTCGGGNMLYGVENVLRSADQNGSLRNASGERYSFKAYGQELNDQLFALCSIEGRHHEHADIREGNTLSQDKFAGEQFNVIVANPPYGTDWKQIQKDIEKDTSGRFPEHCRPSVSDGQQLFLQHIQHHLSDDGIAMVFCSGSTLFSGDAGGGESNARSQYILKDDGVWGLIQLPKNEFFNTGINTYVWVFWKGKPEKLKKKMFLLNAETMFQKMRKSMGSKNSEMSPYDQERVKCLVESAELCFEDNRNNFALTIDLENRNTVATISGWGTMDGGILVSNTDKDKFDENRSIQNEIHIKQIESKDATLTEPVYLRGLNTEQVHYNKLGLELRRGGKDAFKGEPIDLKKCVLRISLNADVGDLWIASGSSVADVGAALQLAQINGLLDMGELSENDSKAVENTLKSIVDNSTVTVFVDPDSVVKTGVCHGNDAWHSLLHYQLTQDEVIVASDGTQLGVGVVKIKTSFNKPKGKVVDSLLNVTASLGPKLEKDSETIAYHEDPAKNENEIQQFLKRWVQDSHVRTGVTVGCEINFNQVFPKISERKTLNDINHELAQLDAQIAQLHQGGVL